MAKSVAKLKWEDTMTVSKQREGEKKYLSYLYSRMETIDFNSATVGTGLDDIPEWR
jgi:hypothetical protein